MLPGKCYYVGQVGEQARSLAGVIQDFFTSGWEPLVRGGIDGYNISEFLIDKRCGLEWDYAAFGQTGPKKLCAPALSETAVPAMRRKGPTGSTKRYGLELVVDPTGPGATYGRVCVVSKTDLTKQIISLIPEDPASATNPAGSVLANYGKAKLGTSGDFDWELHRNGVASLYDNGSSVTSERGLAVRVADTDVLIVGDQQTQVYGELLFADLPYNNSVTTAPLTDNRSVVLPDASGTVALTGDFRLSSTTQTASNAGNYAVAATIATVFVDANALTAGQNYDVTLPSGTTYANRLVRVKITVVGAGGSTVTVKSSAGTVEGVAAGTGVALDSSARSKVTYQSDGTNWWNVGG